MNRDIKIGVSVYLRICDANLCYFKIQKASYPHTSLGVDNCGKLLQS